MQHWLEGIGVTLVVGFAVGKFLPGFVTGKIHTWLELAKVSVWWKNPLKPWRWNLLKSVFLFLEGELPDEGSEESKPFYMKWANRIVSFLSFIPILKGTVSTWASALEKAGNKVDTELKEDIKGIDTVPPIK